MSPAIRSELLRVLDRYAVEIAEPTELVDIADKVLIDGTYTDSLGELTYLRDRAMIVVGPVFEAAINELDISLPDRDAAAVRVVRVCASEIANNPESAHGHLVTIRELQWYSDLDVDAEGLAYLAWIFEGSEDLFDDQGRLVEDEPEWSRWATHYALEYAQDWLTTHPEEARV